jgi:hypothetical protein
MTIKINLKAILVALAILCYPLNYWTMRTGFGIYNNDPKHEWRDMGGQKTHGPSMFLRSISFVTSPISVPFNGLAWVVMTTMPPEFVPED